MALKFINAGGSLTLSAVLLAALWAVRSMRAAARLQRAKSAASSAQNGVRTAPKYLCKLSPASVALLAKLQAVPHCIIDVRAAFEAAADPLPAWLVGAVHIPEPQLTAALAHPHSAWYKYTSSITNSSTNDSSNTAAAAQESDATLASADPPLLHHLLVLIGVNEQQETQAAARAAAAGFDRVALIQGGRKALLQQTATPTSSGSDFAFRTEHAAAVDQPAADQAAPAAAQLPSLHRDALALLLDLVPLPESAYALCSSIIGQKDPLQQQPPPPGQGVGVDVFAGADASSSGSSSQRLLVLDVRRHDERTLYGSIPGTVHVPVDELASALQLHPDQFRRRYHFEPPAAADVLVMQSRGNKRAQWAAQIAVDAGLPNVYVYQEGVFEWRFSPAVQAYAAYHQGEVPPEPEPFNPGQPDIGGGVAELQQLGLLQLLLQQHSLH